MRTKPQIATRNDLFRHTMIEVGGNRVVLTEGVQASPDRELIITCVQRFNDFHNGNDPHKERDFGTVLVNNQVYYFKIDYYTPDLKHGADPHVDDYALVLTIMREDEY